MRSRTQKQENRPVDNPSSERDEKFRRVRSYLRAKTREGERVLYVKSKEIAADLEADVENGISSYEVGYVMEWLSRSDAETDNESRSASKLLIEQWARTRATTWRVERTTPG